MKIHIPSTSCISDGGRVSEKPDTINPVDAIRESLRNIPIGYRISGAGYDYPLEPDDIREVREVEAPQRGAGDEWKNHGRKFFKVDVYLKTPGEHRVIDVEVEVSAA